MFVATEADRADSPTWACAGAKKTPVFLVWCAVHSPKHASPGGLMASRGRILGSGSADVFSPSLHAQVNVNAWTCGCARGYAWRGC